MSHGKEVQNQARRLSSTLTDLLSSTQPHDAQLLPVDGGRLIQRTVAILRPSFNRLGHRLETQIDPRCPPLLVDEEWLVQVLINLVVNSEEALRNSGCTCVQLHPDPDRPDQANLEVIDNGIGMAPEVLARVGEPFYTTRERGTGLGLAMSRDLVARMGGTLTIRSEVSIGTTVRLALRTVAQADRELI